jgi:hypothetical protein
LPLNFVPTHETGGLPGFPAIDNFAKPGTLVFPPEGGTLHYRHFIEWDAAKRIGGGTIYLHGFSGAWYFLTHFDMDTAEDPEVAQARQGCCGSSWLVVASHSRRQASWAVGSTVPDLTFCLSSIRVHFV